jgi:hypothetical protein
MSVQCSGIQSGRRATDLDEVAQDLLHLVGIGDRSKNSHLGRTPRTDQRVYLVDLGDELGPGRAQGISALMINKLLQ